MSWKHKHLHKLDISQTKFGFLIIFSPALSPNSLSVSHSLALSLSLSFCKCVFSFLIFCSFTVFSWLPKPVYIDVSSWYAVCCKKVASDLLFCLLFLLLFWAISITDFSPSFSLFRHTVPLPVFFPSRRSFVADSIV